MLPLFFHARFSRGILPRQTARLVAPLLAGGLLAIFLTTGCGEHAPKLTSQQSKAFDNAPADVKETWDKALAADKANDYVTAAALLDNLKKMYLSDEQAKALDAERITFGERLMQAVDKNDPQAIKAAQNSQKTRS